MAAPVPHDPPCPRCAEHPWHGLPCDRDDCDCTTSAWNGIFPDPDNPLIP